MMILQLKCYFLWSFSQFLIVQTEQVEHVLSWNKHFSICTSLQPKLSCFDVKHKTYHILFSLSRERSQYSKTVSNIDLIVLLKLARLTFTFSEDFVYMIYSTNNTKSFRKLFVFTNCFNIKHYWFVLLRKGSLSSNHAVSLNTLFSHQIFPHKNAQRNKFSIQINYPKLRNNSDCLCMIIRNQLKIPVHATGFKKCLPQTPNPPRLSEFYTLNPQSNLL